jgi:FSR family fosmidomycin resistance protein-like MFS transporter
MPELNYFRAMLDTIACVNNDNPDEILIEESSNALPLPKQENNHTSLRVTGSIALAHGVHDMFSGFLPPLLPILIAKFGLSNLSGGSLTLFYSLPSLLQPVIGSLADRKNLRILVSLAPLVTGAVMTLLGIAPATWVMMLMLVLAGLSSAALHAIGPALNSKHAGVNLGRGMSFWVNAGTLGYALGTIVLVSAYDLLGLSGLPILLIVGASISALTWRGLRDVDTSIETVRNQKGKPKDWTKIFRVILPIAFINVTRAMMVASLSTYFPAFLLERGASTWVSGASMTLIFGAGVLGSYIAGSLSDRYNRLSILAVVTISLFTVMMIFLRVDGWLQIPILLLMGFFEIAAMPVLMSVVQVDFSEDRAFMNGLFLSINFVSGALAVPVVGRLADLYSFQTTFQLAAYMLPFGLIGLGWLQRLNKTSRL